MKETQKDTFITNNSGSNIDFSLTTVEVSYLSSDYVKIFRTF